MEKLTKKQEIVLNIIKKNIAEKGYPPTVREIGNKLGLSSSATTQFHICKLVEKGYLRKNNTKNRTIELLVPNEYVEKNNGMVSIPFIGRVTKGNPTNIINAPDEFMQVPTAIIGRGKDAFALTMDGNSMINAGIYDGDIVIVERKNIAHNKEKVVALTPNNDLTIKTFYKKNGRICLQSENDTMDSIILPNVTILGKVIGLYRKI